MFATVIYPADKNYNEPEKSFQVETDANTEVGKLNDIWRQMNIVDGSDFELPNKLHCRSMMVGDIIQLNDTCYIVDNFGWYKASKDYVSIWKLLSTRDRLMGPEYFCRKG